MKDKERSELTSQLRRCTELYSSGVLYTDSVFTQSVFVELLIRLDDILMFLSRRKHRVSFTDDVSGRGISDIIDLVNKLRNAACHERTSGENSFGTSKFTFCRFLGGAKMQMGDVSYASDYQDDIAFFYGDERLYVNRHIRRLLEETPGKIRL